MKKSHLIPVLIATLFSSCHVGRFFIWNFADIRDHKKFPSQQIKSSATPFYFNKSETQPLRMPKYLTHKNDSLPFEKHIENDGTVAFLVIRNDSILYEKYFNNYDSSDEVPSFSVAKSFVSALVGIAIDEGKIKSIKDPITNYLPELRDPGYKNITIEHLLQMRSGIKFNESYVNPFGDAAKYYYGRNLRKYLVKQKIELAPDSQFNYISINTQLLGWIVERATGKPLASYLEEKIWLPMGMESPASWSVDSKKHQMAKGFCCINARAIDFAKLGRLYLNKGNWNGKQIVSEAWVDSSVTVKDYRNYYLYTYQWWHTRDFSLQRDSLPIEGLHQVVNIRKTDKDKGTRTVITPSGDFFAEGHLGQFIYVYPEKNIIIVRLGKKYGATPWAQLFKEIARNN
jgi:CubicO group peptidase (beta-lactamase class C family)